MENAKRYILGVIMLLALIQGCYEDEGNYDYSPLPSIQINGMNTIYHPRRLLDSLIIPITVETEYASSDLKYTWFIFNSGKVDYISAVGGRYDWPGKRFELFGFGRTWKLHIDGESGKYG